MATEDLVTEQFQFLGIDVQKEVVLKCVSLCEEYDVDAETFIEQWMAFSLNNLNGAPPTVEHLESLARKEFSKRAANRSNATTKDALQSAGTGLTVYGAVLPSQPDNAVLSNYISTTTPKRKKIESEAASPLQIELRPATYSPNVDQSGKYTSRSNPGSVVHSCGDEKLLQVIDQPNSANILNLNVCQMPNDEGDCYGKAMFGFELLHEKVSHIDNHISYISKCIMKKAVIKETCSVRHKTQTEVAVVGRIECDADARLNPKSVVLQGTWEDSLSQAVPVDIDNLKQYSLFPGQVVVMKGINPRGDKFIAHEVYCDASLPQIDQKSTDIMNLFAGTISMVVASGPYTTSENLNFEPLKDLAAHVSNHRPHILLLTGPFLDADHPRIKDNSLAETYKSLFEKLIDSLGELSTTSPFTKIFIVSSLKDAFHVNIFPTPAYSCRRKCPNVQFLPDPCTLNIGGLVVGITATDVLMHISQEEISLGGSDRLSRLAAHVIQQQSYYAVGGGAVPLDTALWAAHAQLPVTPHLLILPSNFRYFVKDVNGCVVINPEHLTKGAGGGTFARVLVSSQRDSKQICAQILRI